MPIRRLVPILIVNVLVVMAVTLLIVKEPSQTRGAALVMLFLFVGDFLFKTPIPAHPAKVNECLTPGSDS
jgi:hypothetical protein